MTVQAELALGLRLEAALEAAVPIPPPGLGRGGRRSGSTATPTGRLRRPAGTSARSLVTVDQQFPKWRRLPAIGARPRGTGSAIARLGDHLGARFPPLPGGTRVRGARV